MGIREWFRSVRSGEDREVREEIVFHLDRATQENIARGMGPEEARAEALRRFGDLEQVRRDCLAARGRGVSPIVGWSAVAVLVVASFVGGYAVRSGGGNPSAVPTFAGSTIRTAVLKLIEAPTARRLRPLPDPFAAVRWRNEVEVTDVSPFTAWRWRDGVPEVKLDGEGWYELVSAAGIPAATLREANRKAQGLPEGMYLDGNPHVMILGNKGCKGPTVEIVLRSLTDGGEVRMACAGGWKKVQRIPSSKWPAKKPK